MIAAVDLGGTKVAGALFNREGTVVLRDQMYLQNRSGSDVGVIIRDMVIDLLEKGQSVEAVGVAVPGIYRSKEGTVWAPNIDGWENYPLERELNALLSPRNISLHIDSDRSCYILGEAWRGAAQGLRNGIFLAVGTGIGAGIMVDGRVLRGSHGVAGSIGWLAVTHPFLSDYTTYGCFEYHASGSGIARVANKIIAETGQKISVPGKGELDLVSTEDVFQAYHAADPLASKVIDLSVEFWGKAVANLVSLFDPEVIVFGGGVFGPGLALLDNIGKEAEKWAQPISFKLVDLKPSVLGGDAGLYGAGYLALKKF